MNNTEKQTRQVLAAEKGALYFGNSGCGFLLQNLNIVTNLVFGNHDWSELSVGRLVGPVYLWRSLIDECQKRNDVEVRVRLLLNLGPENYRLYGLRSVSAGVVIECESDGMVLVDSLVFTFKSLVSDQAPIGDQCTS